MIHELNRKKKLQKNIELQFKMLKKLSTTVFIYIKFNNNAFLFLLSESFQASNKVREKGHQFRFE